MKVEPKNQNLNSDGILGKNKIVGTVYILTKKDHITELENMINTNLEKLEAVSIGTSLLPNESGIIVKILGDNTEDIFKLIYSVLKITRKKILGVEFSKIRKN